jgi:heterodisulfide reductase subunit C
MGKVTGKWGFSQEKSNLVNLDLNDTGLYSRLVSHVPGLAACIFCGSCGATCISAAEGMNFRLVHLMVRRGELHQVRDMLRACQLCGKCTLVCPRNVDTRAVIFTLKTELHELF